MKDEGVIDFKVFWGFAFRQMDRQVGFFLRTKFGHVSERSRNSSFDDNMTDRQTMLVVKKPL